MRSLRLVAVAALAIVVVSACGGSTTAAPSVAGAASATPAGAAPSTAAPAGGSATPAAPAGGSIDTCGVLSAADLSAATGKKYEAGFLDSSGNCSWNVGPNPGNSGNLIIASIQAQPLQTIKSTFPGGVDVTVKGHAGYWNGAQGLASMWVDIGGRLFILSFPRSADLGPDDQAIAQKLAEIAVARM